MSGGHTEVFHVDPLHNLRADGAALIDLAFGSLSRVPDPGAGRHLALLPTETLELDLSDPAQRRFGDYELLELIGEGGMGVVYRARQLSLDREVAVKLLAAGLWASKEFIERFRREAQNAARMQHPNIVTIYEVGSAEELHFFSMRLIHGMSLAAVIRRDGKLAPLRAASLLRTIAEAVDYAHRLGVLHLDLKPANVLLDENGVPHVADFGLARRLEEGLATENEEVSGTPSYMAPEQATAGVQQITPATDIWGLGAILYEFVTGQPPFLGDSAQATLKQVVHGDLHSPRNYVPNLPRDLEAIILKCMARDVATRYPTARALADDLGRFIENRPVRARRLNGAQRVWRWSRRQPFIAALSLLFTVSMLTGIIGVTTQWKRAENNASRARSNAMISSERLWESRREAALRLETDGKGFEALPALIANIEEQEKAGKASTTSIERYEIGMIFHQGVTLIDRMILPDAHPLAAELSADGSILAIALGDQSVRWFDTKTLTERGRVDLSRLATSNGEDIAPRLLRFIDDKRLLVTLDWPDYMVNPNNHDSDLIDLEHARVIEPPAQFANLADAVYSANGRYALLFDQQDGKQFWQVEPWHALSARTIDKNRHLDGWLLGRDGSYALGITTSDRTNLALFDPRNPAPRKLISLLGFAQVTAWAENNAGSLVALGDSTGHVYVLDPHTGVLRPLPTPRGTHVNWLAFSEDDAWLAAVRRDGAAFAFDVASGDPLNAGQMQQDADVRQVAISHRDRLLVASGFGQTVVWRFPQPGPTGLVATRLISSPPRSPHALTNAVGVSLQTGLLATTDISGEVRLWRLPRAPLLPTMQAQADTSMAANLYFDGRHLPDVAWNKVRVVSTDGAALTPWITLPQPLAYAELLDNGKTMLATSGPALYVFDAASMRQRYPAVPLPANPIRMVASADGAFVVFAFGSNGSAGFEERLQAYDLKTGQLRPGSVTVKGPLRQFELSPDATRLIATGPPHGATEVFETANLNRQGSYAHDPERPVVWASFAPPSQRIWLLAHDLNDETSDNADLIAWDPAANAVRERRTIPGITAVGVTAAIGRPILATREHDLFDPAAANAGSGQRNMIDEYTSKFAVSHNHRLIAHVLGRDVQLHDAATLAAIGPPLYSNLGAVDDLGELVFSADDGYLLSSAATRRNALLWAVAADTRPLAEIRRDAELLSPEAGEQRVLQIPGAEQRDRLHRNDPGAPPSSDARPEPPVARTINGILLPARDPGTSPLLLDLTQAYTAAPFALRDLYTTVMPATVGLPFGVARLDGVDYDVRGIVELRQYSGAATMVDETKPSTIGIQVPRVPIAAFHVLISAAEDKPETAERDYALIRLHYVDGSTAVLPIRTQRDVPGYTDNDKPVPVAFAYGEATRFIGFLKQSLVCNPRLTNPHPERLIATLDLEAAPTGWSEPVFLAVTAEAVDKLGAGSFDRLRTQPVIGVGSSGSKSIDGGVK